LGKQAGRKRGCLDLRERDCQGETRRREKEYSSTFSAWEKNFLTGGGKKDNLTHHHKRLFTGASRWSRRRGGREGRDEVSIEAELQFAFRKLKKTERGSEKKKRDGVKKKGGDPCVHRGTG